MSTAEERADLKANPLPDCSTCVHCYESEASCKLQDMNIICSYAPDELHDDTLPSLEQAYHIQAEIQNLQDKLKKFQSRYDALVAKAAAAKIEKEGSFVLVDKKRSVRVPDPVKFKEQFPDAYTILKQEDIDRQMKKIDEMLAKDLTTIPVKRAEDLVGKVPLTKICDENVYHNYSVVREA